MAKVISSVEWFAKKVKDHCDRTGREPSYHQIGEWKKEAKAIHKEEIIKSWMAVNNELQRIAAEKYYNETFGNEND